jgi:hypothetical protein
LKNFFGFGMGSSTGGGISPRTWSGFKLHGLRWNLKKLFLESIKEIEITRA